MRRTLIALQKLSSSVWRHISMTLQPTQPCWSPTPSSHQTLSQCHILRQITTFPYWCLCRLKDITRVQLIWDLSHPTLWLTLRGQLLWICPITGELRADSGTADVLPPSPPPSLPPYLPTPSLPTSLPPHLFPLALPSFISTLIVPLQLPLLYFNSLMIFVGCISIICRVYYSMMYLL